MHIQASATRGLPEEVRASSRWASDGVSARTASLERGTAVALAGRTLLQVNMNVEIGIGVTSFGPPYKAPRAHFTKTGGACGDGASSSLSRSFSVARAAWQQPHRRGAPHVVATGNGTNHSVADGAYSDEDGFQTENSHGEV